MASDAEKKETRRRGMTGRVAFKAMYQCQADGMHHADCPGRSSTWATGIRGPAWTEFDKHHLTKKAWKGKDHLSNFLWVFHKCHKKIHSNEAKAVELGLLKPVLKSHKLIPTGKQKVEKIDQPKI